MNVIFLYYIRVHNIYYISSTRRQEQHTEREKEDKKKELDRNKEVKENGDSIREKKIKKWSTEKYLYEERRMEYKRRKKQK